MGNPVDHSKDTSIVIRIFRGTCSKDAILASSVKSLYGRSELSHTDWDRAQAILRTMPVALSDVQVVLRKVRLA